VTAWDLAAATAYARGLPKAELHVHLEGTLEPELLFALAQRNDVALRWPTASALREAYAFDGLQPFLDLYFEGCQVLSREVDFHQLTLAYLQRAHADGVVRAEVFLGPQSFTDRGVPLGDVLGGVFRAFDEAAATWGISAGLLVSAHRHRSEAEAFAQLDAVLPWGHRIAGFGLGGAEVGNPPSRFADYFRELRRLGFRTTAHAGEEGPADYVRQAVEVLQVDRIDHGVAVLDDPELTAAVASRSIPLTVCPVSNAVLHVVPSLEAHPLPAMRAAGLNVTLGSDDPAYFGGYLAEVYGACAMAFGLSRHDLDALAAASLAAAFG
jgi:adenosine deaminase